METFYSNYLPTGLKGSKMTKARGDMSLSRERERSMNQDAGSNSHSKPHSPPA